MNHLSKLLYWADVFSHLGPILGGLGAICIVIALILFCVSLSDDNSDADQKKAKSLATRFAIASFFGISISVFTPSKETVYAIAASEVGEQVLKSPIVGKAEKALETWLDKQINAK